MKLSETDSIKNALVNVSTLARTSDYYNPDRDLKDIELIESIVMKEIPKKPIDKQTCAGHLKPYCPNCDLELCYVGAKYCHHCGQRIDWEDEEE